MAMTNKERQAKFQAKKRDERDKTKMLDQIDRVKELLKDHYSLIPIEECNTPLITNPEELALMEETSKIIEKLKEENEELKNAVIRLATGGK